MAAPKGNRYGVGAGGGRPPVYKNVKEMEKEINAYFNEWIKGESKTETKLVHDPITGKDEMKSVTTWIREPEPITRTGLILFLGFESDGALDHYCKKSDEFLALIKRAKLLIQNSYERKLMGRETFRGAQFVLGNMGWTNRTEIQNLDKDGRPTDPPANKTIITNVLPNTQNDL